MAASAEEKQTAFSKLVAQGASPEDAAKFLGMEPPKPEATSATEPKAKPETAPARQAPNVGRIPTPSGARRVILGVMLLGLALGTLRDVRSGTVAVTDVLPRKIVGTFISTILLMLLAGPLPKVAQGLAVLVGFTVIAYQTETIEFLARVGGGNVVPAGGNSGRFDGLDEFDEEVNPDAGLPPGPGGSSGGGGGRPRSAI